MNIVNHRHIIIFLIIILVLWFLITLLRILTRPKKIVKQQNEPKLYLNNVGNGTRMVIGGFSHPNYLYGMNRVPYDGPI